MVNFFNKKKLQNTYKKILSEYMPSQKGFRAELKRRTRKVIFKIIRRLGYLNNDIWTRSRRPMHKTYFWGDRPIGALDVIMVDDDSSRNTPTTHLARTFVIANDYEVEPSSFTISNLRYSKNGFAWEGSTLRESASAAPVAKMFRFFKEIPFSNAEKIKQGTLVQAQTPITFGDWVPEHRNSLLSFSGYPLPLILPRWIADREYVKTELSDLDIPYIVPSKDVVIERATVLPKQRHGNIILADGVERYRNALGVPDVSPQRGQIIYLSRLSFQRSIPVKGRDYPSDIIASIVNQMGGIVIDTNGKDRVSYQEVAAHADIVLADHGGAMFNMMEWKPRIVIEFVADGWWVPCFVFLSAACGANYHGIVRTSGCSKTELQKKIISHITLGETIVDSREIAVMDEKEAAT